MICLIGDVLVDVSLKTSTSKLKMRLGGIVHAARAMWALDVPFQVCYFSPSYLDNQIRDYLQSLNCKEIIKLGTVNGSPYVFLIEDVKEIGDQGYEFLLRDDLKIEYDEFQLEQLSKSTATDFFMITGNYDLASVAKNIKGKAHLDVANNISSFSTLDSLPNKFETIFTSTSSQLFASENHRTGGEFLQLFSKYSNRVILKENRGGSRGLDFDEKIVVSAPAQSKKISHSVGVGDAYDAAVISYSSQYTLEQSMHLASWIASEYAATTYPDDFKLAVGRIKNSKLEELMKLKGVILPWECRQAFNIYIAAPDFDFVNVAPVDSLVESLTYHNFNPRRPIKENGQMEKDADKSRRQTLFSKDMALLEQSAMLVAVLLYNDPGTLIEIGLAAAKGLPTLVYDPYNIADNCMLTELPRLVSSDLDEIISEVFQIASNAN